MAMTVDRGTLARIDRRLLSELHAQRGPQLAKVPVSEAVWDVWRRYCRLAGVAMGEGLAILLTNELGIAIEESKPVDRVLDSKVAARITDLSGTIAEQERLLESARDQLRRRDEQIRFLEQQLRSAQHQLATAVADTAPTRVRVGRNDRCPCGSGLKYKFCQAMNHRSGDQPGSAPPFR
jgi:hypothetical protein